MLKKIACCSFVVLSLGGFLSGRILNTRAQNDGKVVTSSPPQAGAQQAQPAVNVAERDAAIAEIKKRIAGREDEPAEQVFKNIEILKGKKASRLPAMMSALTGLLGVNCTHCHVNGQWDSEEKPTKQTARKMFRMVGGINKDYFDGKNAVSCWTCHRGHPRPPIQ